MPTTTFRGGTGGGGSAYFGDPGFIYDTISWPVGNLNIDGSRPVVVTGVYPEASGYSSATVSSDGYVRIYRSSGTVYFSRNQSAGGVVTLSSDGYTWNGALTGYFTWATVATMPTGISPVRTGRDVTVTIAGSSSNGDSSISSYQVQHRSRNIGGAWSAWGGTQTVAGSTTTYTNLTAGKEYQFRTFANNGVGSSQARESSVVFIPAGGKRNVGGTYQVATIARRKSGGSWVDLTTAKRRESGAYVNLS